MKTFRNIFIVFGILFLSFNADAQLKVKTNGYVGIGTSSPLKVLHVYGTSLFQCSVNKNIELSPWNVSGNGCVTLATHNDNNSAHIPMTLAASSFYFHLGAVGIGRNPSSPYLLDVNGSIRVGSIVYPSDEKLKLNIMPISSQTNNLLKLRSVSYKLNHEEMKSKSSSSDTDSLSRNKLTSETALQDDRIHYGFLAQDVKKIYPELVYEDEAGTLGIDYVSFIPLLITELKNQNETIENLKHEIQTLKATNVNTIMNRDKSLGELYQNYPNPFDQTTTIKFKLSNNTNSAEIYVYNLQGNLIKSYSMNNADESIEIKASELKPGMYLYSLLSNGMVVDTKTMVLSE